MELKTSVIMGTGADYRQQMVHVIFPRFEEMHTILEDYQTSAIRRKDQSWSHLQLQTHLMVSMITELRFLKQLRDGSVTAYDEKSRGVIEFLTIRSIQALTQIADGIAFRFLGANQGLCQPLLAKGGSPWALLEDGFWNALEIGSHILDASPDGSQLLITDLNEITNIGDLMLKIDEHFSLIEVKRGKKRRGARLTRQKQRLEEAENLINKRAGMIEEFYVEMIDVPARTHWIKHIGAAFERLESSIVQFDQLTDYHCVCCVDLSRGTQDEIRNELASMFTTIKRVWGNSRVYEMSSDSATHPRFAGMLVPMTVFPLPTSLVVDLILGSKVYFSFLNLDAIFERARSAGWNIRDLTLPGEKGFLEVAKAVSMDEPLFLLEDRSDPDLNMGFSARVLAQMAAGLFTFESFLRQTEVIIDAGKERPGQVLHWIPSFPDESNFWL